MRTVNRVKKVNGAVKGKTGLEKDCCKVIFHDEMSVIVNGDGKIIVWRKRDEGYLPQCTRNRQFFSGRNLKVMV